MRFWRRTSNPASVIVQNGTDSKLLFIFEPWCWTAELAPGERLLCRATGKRDGCFEVEYTKDSITLYGWDTSVATVHDAAGKILVDLSIPVPDFIGMAEKRAKIAK